MNYHTLVYNLPAAGINAVNSDMVAAIDPEFTARNNHYVLTEPYRLGMITLVGASVIRGRILASRYNAVMEATIFSANRGLQPPSNPQWDLYMVNPPPIPMLEELQIQVSNNLGAATEIENCVIQMVTDDWTANLPRGLVPTPLIARATFTVTPTLNAWSGGQILALSQNIRAGTYAITGCAVQGTNAVAYRLIFPRYHLYKNMRKLRPGGLIQTAVGDALSNQWSPWVQLLGELGRFHSYEPPTIEVFGTAAVSTTYQVFLWLTQLDDAPLAGAQGISMAV